MEGLTHVLLFSNVSPNPPNLSSTNAVYPPALLPPPNLSLALPAPMLTALLALYIPVILLAVLGSLLVILSVIR